MIGNDVLDLGHRGCRPRRPGDRFLDRILDDSERDWLEAGQPGGPWHARLWALWAAKETAFKASSRAVGPRAVFSPRTLICTLQVTPVGPPGARSSDALSIRGTVRGSDLPGPVTVRGTSDGEHVHVVGWLGTSDAASASLEAGVQRLGEDADLEALRDRFTPAEWQGVHSPASAIVRLEARERLRALMCRAGQDGESRTIEILTSPGPDGTGRLGQTPPTVHVDGRAVSGWELSLSHHGRYVAWAVTGSAGS